MGWMGQLPRSWAVREKPSFSAWKGEGAHLWVECEPAPLNPLCLNTHSPTWHPVWEGGAFRRRSLAGGIAALHQCGSGVVCVAGGYFLFFLGFLTPEVCDQLPQVLQPF